MQQQTKAARAPRRVLSLVSRLGAAALLVAGAGSAPQAQPANVSGSAQPASASLSSDAIKQREQELEDTRSQQKSAAEAQEKLKAEVAALAKDRSALNEQLITVVNRMRGIETQMGASENRLRALDTDQDRIRQSLASRRSEIVEVLAALQRAGRRTPPALLVRPEDALRSLRTAMLLGAVVPEMRSRAETLVGELTELVRVRKQIADERDRLAADRDRMNADEQRLAALVDARQKQQSQVEQNIEAERQRAATLARQVNDLQELIAKMELDLKAAAKAAAAANIAGTPPSANGKPNLGALKDPGRLSPAVAFASARGLLPLPVNGVKIRGFGGSDGIGGIQRGISIATRTGAQVTTPCDGWVVYAGPFRSYGQLLILNAGGGYHVLLAGMERISVNIGQFVLTGEPVATMGTTSQVASMLAATPSQPVLYIEFRKDGTPVDPGPWWAAGEGEKVRG